MKNNILILLFLFSLFFSCTKIDETERNIPIDIDIEKINSVSFYDWFSSVELIPLETTENSLISRIRKAYIHKNRMCFLDKGQDAVFIFSQNGKFIRKIQGSGRGPGEYNMLYDFVLNRFTHNLELLDPTGRILVYDIEGTFLHTLNIPAPVRGTNFFINLTEDLILLYTSGNEKLVFYSRSTQKILGSTFPVSKKITASVLRSFDSPFYVFDGKVNFFQGFSNKVYRIEDNELAVNYTWDFDPYNLNVDDFPDNLDIKAFSEYILKLDCAIGFNNYTENDVYILCSFIFKERFYYLLYNKLNTNYVIFNNFKEGYPLSETPVFSNNSMVCISYPSILLEHKESIVFNEKNKRILDKLKVLDNPVILKHNFH